MTDDRPPLLDVPIEGCAVNWDLTAEQCAALKARLSRSIDSSAGPDECWPWTGSLNRPNGYGKSHIMVGRRQVAMNASRAVYLAENGKLAADEFILHSCDNPPCCNPSHLRPGSHQENMDDRRRRGKYYSGADNSRAVQVPADVVAEIRAAYAPRKAGRSQLALAAYYGINRATIQNIVNRKGRWAEESAA